MSRGTRVLIAIGGALLGMIVLVIGEVLTIGYLGGTTDGTGLVAFGLMPFAGIFGAAIGGTMTWRRISRSPR